jgi:ankyrin repeat protein
MKFYYLLSLIVVVGLLTSCITTPDEVQIAPIHGAITAGNTAKVERLAAKRRQLSELNEYGETPLLYAVKTRKAAIVDVLLAKGADVNATNSHTGETPLIAAVRNRDLVLVNRLLSAGARLDQADSEGATPLIWACRSGAVDVVQALVVKLGRRQVSATPAAILTAAAFGHRQLVENLLAMGSSIEARSARAETPLILAARFGHGEIVQLLVTKGADVNAVDANNAGSLAWAARLGHGEIVGILLDAGAVTGKKDSQGFTPLMHAVRLGHVGVVDRLLAWSLNHKQTLRHDLNLMYWAALQSDIAERLYQAGAEDDQVYHGDVPAIEAAGRYLWLARFYESKLVNTAGRDDFDHANMAKTYGWAASFFDTAAREYAQSAERIKSQQASAETGAAFMLGLASVANAMQADIRAKQTAEIGALGQASSQGTGLSGYYSALDSYKSSYTPSSGGMILGSNYGLRPSASTPDNSASAYAAEAARCQSTAKACRAIVYCYSSADFHSDAVSNCVNSARKGIKHLK